MYDGAAVEGFALYRTKLASWIERWHGSMSPTGGGSPGLEPGRADVIVAGLVCLELALERLRAERFTVSERGVRHGVALRLLAGHQIV